VCVCVCTCACVKQHLVPFEICVPEYTYNGKAVFVNAMNVYREVKVDLQSLLILALDGLSGVIQEPMALFLRK
jgi:hypothetical protein